LDDATTAPDNGRRLIDNISTEICDRSNFIWTAASFNLTNKRHRVSANNFDCYQSRHWNRRRRLPSSDIWLTKVDPERRVAQMARVNIDKKGG